jgi:hypothetical protein
MVAAQNVWICTTGELLELDDTAVQNEHLFVSRSRGAHLSGVFALGGSFSRGRHYRLPGGLFKDVLRPPLCGRAPPGP